MKYLKKCLPILLGFILMIQTVQMPSASENRDYLDITMADIIVAWYNASGVAIGYTSIVNDIYQTFGNAKLSDLVNNGVIKSYATNDKEEIKQLIGYGNLTAPTVYVDMERFRFWLTHHPYTSAAAESIQAMFSSLGGDSQGIQGLACVLGMVANLGKIPYSFEPNTASNVTNENITNVTSLKNVYNNFVQTNYFINLLETSDTGEEDYLSPYSVRYPQFVPDNTRISGVLDGNNGSGQLNRPSYNLENIFGVLYGKKYYLYNANEYSITEDYTNRYGYMPVNNYQIDNTAFGHISSINIEAHSLGLINEFSINVLPVGNVIEVPVSISTEDIEQYCESHNPWNTSSSGGNGKTEYINSAVGNLDSENYQNANPNIMPNEYMYIFNRTTYETIIDTINQNTNNGQYTENGNIINNYNNTYIQDTSTPNVRPSLPPTSGEVPAQPFITPRPDLPVEEVEEIIYGGNVPGEIEKKFPFCIPWDIKACVDYFWSPTRKAPHIHWNASFGEWGNLGEIDVDLSPYNTVATIHRALMLIAWIVGLAIITPKILP